jgi:hypothetical protein
MTRPGRIVFMAGCTLLAACGGGSGGGNYNPQAGPSTTATPALSTTAQGTLVDDPSGAPLAGVAVRLDPWQWGSGPVSGAAPAYTPPPDIVPGPSPTPIAITTTDPQGRFTVSAANGTYLLVIGSDDPSDTNRPTIHDRIVLNGQAILVGPTMPPVPGITPAPVETNGDYRLVTIDQTHELPCIQDYGAQRVQRGLPKPVIDEWLTENVRAAVNQSVTPFNKQTAPSNPYGFLSTGNATVTGGTDCVNLVNPAFMLPNQWAISTAAEWYAGSYLPYQSRNGTIPAYGASLFPIDPRLFEDPNVAIWP